MGHAWVCSTTGGSHHSSWRRDGLAARRCAEWRRPLPNLLAPNQQHRYIPRGMHLSAEPEIPQGHPWPEGLPDCSTAVTGLWEGTYTRRYAGVAQCTLFGSKLNSGKVQVVRQ